MMENAKSRFIDELKNERPDIIDLRRNYMIISGFRFFFRDLTQEYFKAFHDFPTNENLFIKDGKFSYQLYKAYRLKKYEELKAVAPLFEDLANAIKRFCNGFEPFDTKKTLQNFVSWPEEE